MFFQGLELLESLQYFGENLGLCYLLGKVGELLFRLLSSLLQILDTWADVLKQLFFRRKNCFFMLQIHCFVVFEQFLLVCVVLYLNISRCY